jgi:NADH-quinone oxidoreductase subunit H
MTPMLWAIVAAIVKSGIIILALLTAFAYMTLIERRVIARFQRRVGPNRAGPLGLFQPIADALKMIFKEQIIPTYAKLGTYLAAPAIAIFIALIAFAVVPLGSPQAWGTTDLAKAWAPLLADINVGILYILAVSSLAVYGIVLAGWSSGNRYSLLGALRSAAQMVSYEVSIALTLTGVLMLSGTLSMVGIVNAQVHQGIWFVAAQPLAAVLYAIAATAEVNRAPFDLPEAEQELVAGYLTEFSGLRWSLFQMAEYINMITVSSVLATLFFGGWTLGGLDGIPGLPFVWYVIKVFAFLFVFIWVRATLPRIRYDQLMRFGWQVLLPLSVLNMLVTAGAVVFGLPWWATGIFGVGVLLILGTISFARLHSHRGERGMHIPSEAAAPLELPSSVKLVRVPSAADAISSAAQASGDRT